MRRTVFIARTLPLRGKTTRQDGCPTCTEMGDLYTYGYGVVISGSWLLQNPLFSGFAGAESYLPSQKIAIAVAATYEPEAFDATTGSAPNYADDLWRKIGTELAPGDAPPTRR